MFKYDGLCDISVEIWFKTEKKIFVIKSFCEPETLPLYMVYESGFEDIISKKFEDGVVCFIGRWEAGLFHTVEKEFFFAPL